MTTKHARFKTALTQAIVNFFLNEDLYAEELRIQGTVCVTADRSAIFVTQITETVTENSHDVSRGMVDSSTNVVPPYIPPTPPNHRSAHWDGGSQQDRGEAQGHGRDSHYHRPHRTVSDSIHSSETTLLKPDDWLSQQLSLHSKHTRSEVAASSTVMRVQCPVDVTKPIQSPAVRTSLYDDSTPTSSHSTKHLPMSRNVGFHLDAPHSFAQYPWLQNVKQEAEIGKRQQADLLYGGHIGLHSASNQSLPSVVDLPLSLQNTLKSLADHRLSSCASTGSTVSDSQEECQSPGSPPGGIHEKDHREPVRKKRKSNQDNDQDIINTGTMSVSDLHDISQKKILEALESRMAEARANQEANHSGDGEEEAHEHHRLSDEHMEDKMEIKEDMASNMSWALGSSPKMEPGSQFFSDWSMNSWIRRPKTKFSPDQLQALETEYQNDPFLSTSADRRSNLARRLNLTEKNIQIWFQNQRRRRRAAAYSKLHYVFSDSNRVMSGSTTLTKSVPSGATRPPTGSASNPIMAENNVFEHDTISEECFTRDSGGMAAKHSIAFSTADNNTIQNTDRNSASPQPAVSTSITIAPPSENSTAASSSKTNTPFTDTSTKQMTRSPFFYGEHTDLLGEEIKTKPGQPSEGSRENSPSALNLSVKMDTQDKTNSED